MRQKTSKKKAFRGSILHNDAASKLLSNVEWLHLFRDTCTGLYKLGTASCHYQLIYFIYCAVVTSRFSGELEKVRESDMDPVLG
jgi:hypothetical protein